MDKIYIGKTKEEIIELIYTLTLQDTNGRETPEEMYFKGIEACFEELFEIQSASDKIVDIDKELKSLSKGKMLKDEVKGVEQVLMRSNPEDGVQGESSLWKLVQGITAHSRELNPQRERELQEIAGELMNKI